MMRVRKYRKSSKLRAEKMTPLAPAKVEAHLPNPVESKRARNVVDALHEHFQRWKPEALANARSI